MGGDLREGHAPPRRAGLRRVPRQARRSVSVSAPVTATVAPALASTVAASDRAEVRRLTRPSEAAAISSATLVSATSRPRPITTRWVAQSCSSLIRWLETSTARPSAASARRNPRIQTMPSGSIPLKGSSRISTGGSARRAAAMPSRWRMPREKPPALRRAHACEPASSSTSSTRPSGKPLRVGEPEEVVASGAGRVQRPCVEEGADMAERVPELGVRLPVDQSLPLRRGRRGRGSPAWWWSCRPRWARRTRSPAPVTPRTRCRPGQRCARTACAPRDFDGGFHSHRRYGTVGPESSR